MCAVNSVRAEKRRKKSNEKNLVFLSSLQLFDGWQFNFVSFINAIVEENSSKLFWWIQNYRACGN